MNSYDNYDEEVKALYHTSKWAKLRAEIVERDNGIDQITGKLITGRYIVDHIQPATVTNFFDPDNLQLLSIETHNKKTFHDLSMSSSKAKKRAKNAPILDLIPFE